MSTPSLLERLMEALRVLPGVGPKSAQRMALAILQKNRPGGRHLAAVCTNPDRGTGISRHTEGCFRGDQM